jgi:hypothetical protein
MVHFCAEEEHKPKYVHFLDQQENKHGLNNTKYVGYT